MPCLRHVNVKSLRFAVFCKATKINSSWCRQIGSYAVDSPVCRASEHRKWRRWISGGRAYSQICMALGGFVQPFSPFVAPLHNNLAMIRKINPCFALFRFVNSFMLARALWRPNVNQHWSLLALKNLAP